MTIRPLAVAAVLVAQTSFAGQELSIRKIVMSGDVLPTASGSIVAGAIDAPPQLATLGEDGTVTFVAARQNVSTSRGLWSWSPSGLGVLTYASDPLPGVGGAVLNGNFIAVPPTLSDGQSCFWLTLGGAGVNSTNNKAMFLGRPGGVNCLWQTGVTQAPGVAAGVTFQSFVNPEEAPHGYLNFAASLQGTGVDPSSAYGLWQRGPSGTRLVMRGGGQIPGEAPGVVWGPMSPYPIATSDGSTIFQSVPYDNGSPRNNGTWRETPSGLEKIFQAGATAPPGMPTGVLFSAGGLAFSHAGNVGVLPGRLEGPGITPSNRDGIWGYANHQIQPIVRQGEPLRAGSAFRCGAMDSGGSYCYATESGRLTVLGAAVDSQNVTRTALLVGDSSGFDVMAQFPGQAPQLPAGTLLGNVFSIDFNESGQVAFSVQLTGSGVTTANNAAVYLMEPSGAFELIARKGSLLEYAPGVFGTVTRIAGENSSIAMTALNERGEVLFGADVNGAAGLFVAIPAPAAAPLLLLSLRRPRRRGSSDPDGPNVMLAMPGERPNAPPCLPRAKRRASLVRTGQDHVLKLRGHRRLAFPRDESPESVSRASSTVSLSPNIASNPFNGSAGLAGHALTARAELLREPDAIQALGQELNAFAGEAAKDVEPYLAEIAVLEACGVVHYKSIVRRGRTYGPPAETQLLDFGITLFGELFFAAVNNLDPTTFGAREVKVIGTGGSDGSQSG